MHTSKQWKTKTCNLNYALETEWKIKLKYRSSNSNLYVIKLNFYSSCCSHINTNTAALITSMARFSWWLSIWQHDLKTFFCKNVSPPFVQLSARICHGTDGLSLFKHFYYNSWIYPMYLHLEIEIKHTHKDAIILWTYFQKWIITILT